MNHIKAFVFLILNLSMLSIPVFAEDNNQKASLIFFDDSTEIEIYDSSDNYISNISKDMILEVGSVIKTNNSNAEIELETNKTILRLSKKSVFKIEAIQQSAQGSNDFILFNGELRIKAENKLNNQNYSIVTQSAACAFKSADIVLSSIGVLTAKDGSVDFSNLISGKTITLTAGQTADVFSNPFVAESANSEKLTSMFRNMEYQSNKTTPKDYSIVINSETENLAIEETPPMQEESFQETEAPKPEDTTALEEPSTKDNTEDIPSSVKAADTGMGIPPVASSDTDYGYPPVENADAGLDAFPIEEAEKNTNTLQRNNTLLENATKEQSNTPNVFFLPEIRNSMYDNFIQEIDDSKNFSNAQGLITYYDSYSKAYSLYNVYPSFLYTYPEINNKVNTPVLPTEKVVKKEEKDKYIAPKPLVTGSVAKIITGEILPPFAYTNFEEKTNTKETKTNKDEKDKVFELSIYTSILNYDDLIFANLVMQPMIDLDFFKIKLYLPITFNDNLFKPDGWYQPSDNNEWSFGTDQNGDFADILLDAGADLSLKIDYIQLGEKDDFLYFKFGNFEEITLGYGILVQDFSNSEDFPKERNFGAHGKIDLGIFDFECIVDNVLLPTGIGTRFSLSPGKSSFGLSLLANLFPDSENNGYFNYSFDPVVYSAAFDFGIPIDIAQLTIFGEIAALTMSIENEFYWNTIYNLDQKDFLSSINNYGAKTGVFGNISEINYKFEYCLYKGAFIPSAFNKDYPEDMQSQSGDLFVYTMFPNSSYFQTTTMAILGEVSANILDVATISGSYKWPWEITEETVKANDEDLIEISIELMPNVIPFVGLHGSFSYGYKHLISSIGNANFDIIGPNSSLETTLIFPFDTVAELILKCEKDSSQDTIIEADNNTFNFEDFNFSIQLWINI